MMIGSLMRIFENLTNIPATDPENARKSKLLNVLIVGITGLLLIFELIFLFIDIFQGGKPWIEQISITSIALLVGLGMIYFFNRKRPGRFIRTCFLLFLTLIFSLSDTMPEISNGRSLFIFIIPIMMASVLLEPASSFGFSALSSAIISIMSLYEAQTPNLPAIGGFFMVALISWVSAHDLELALKEARRTNAELDQRVAERTRELSQSLARESGQASQRQAILQGIADGVMVFDLQGRAILANPAISRLIDLPPDQITGHTHDEILNTTQLPGEERRSLIETLRSIDNSNLHMRVHWGARTLSVSAAPVQEQSGQISGYVAVFRDFTREAEVEEMKNSFVAMVSHEMRTPLNAILGFSEMLKDGFYGPLNDKQRNTADRILNNSRRLLNIVSDLLDKAQIEAGHLNMNIAEFQVTELGEYLHGVMDKVILDKGLELGIQISDEMPAQLCGDSQRIQQVLVNLVNNAAKFTDEGGVQVKIYKVADNFWAFDVIDSGRGISAEDQKTIFDPFRQVGRSAVRSSGGIGLGLSIVKRLVDLMGGRIFLKSIVGQGSTFSVVLPFEPPQKGS